MHLSISTTNASQFAGGCPDSGTLKFHAEKAKVERTANGLSGRDDYRFPASFSSSVGEVSSTAAVKKRNNNNPNTQTLEINEVCIPNPGRNAQEDDMGRVIT